MAKLRFDQVVQELYPELSRSKVKALIENGSIEVFQGQWRVQNKPGLKVESSEFSKDNLRISNDDEIRYVSRGALKLKELVEKFQVPIKGRLCLDVGLSTGGFSDFLLKKGAAKVLGIDVGRDQLHPSLRNHPQLIFRDKVNAREPLPEDLINRFFMASKDKRFDLIVIDVSFISLEKIIENILIYLGENGQLIGLIKPQFELTKNDLNKKGVVKDPKRVQESVEKILGVLQQNKLEILGTCPSPIEGENGNKEFLFLSRRH